MKRRTLYLVSGPAGVGKSTVSVALAHMLENSAYVAGDTLSDFHINGREPPWESDDELSLIWKNIRDLSVNFLESSDVVVDYVAFLADARWLGNQLPDDITMKYIVLNANEDTLIERDLMRHPVNRMKERSLILKHQFEHGNAHERYMLDTGHSPQLDVRELVQAILRGDDYLVVRSPS